MNPETSLQNKIRLKLSKLGILNFRNNTAMAWAGKKVKGLGKMMFVGKQDVIVRNAYPLRAGLAKGSSDIVALEKIIVTQEMVGKPFAKVKFIEVKCPGNDLDPDQVIFKNNVESYGAEFIVACHEDEV